MNKMVANGFKIIVCVVLLPFAVASVISFEKQLMQYSSQYKDMFLWGVMAFIGVFLFVYQFYGLHEFGQQSIAKMLSFVAPLNTFIAKLFPFYVILILLLVWATDKFIGTQGMTQYTMFFAGFFLAMHLLLTAHLIGEGEKIRISLDYLFSMILIVVASLFITVLLLDLVFDKSTVSGYFNKSLDLGQDILRSYIGKLF
ncbi:MAG: hypothetical protein ACI9F2_000699 [Lysobacterales bacterium]|jgi:hypothetical protein